MAITTHGGTTDASDKPEGQGAVRSGDLLAAADLLRSIEVGYAQVYKHIGPRYTRDEMQIYFTDRAALIRVQEILIDRAENLGG